MRISDWSSDVCSSDLLLVAIKDALALLFLLLFFVALFGLLAGRPSASLPVSDGALLLKLDGVVSEQPAAVDRSEEHTSELQSLMRISYAVFCLKKKRQTT